jgi:Uma2 family endonuclease
VDGYVVHRETPTVVQGLAGRLLAGLLERHARTAMDRGRGCFTVDREEDLRLRDVPLLIRRPDVVLRTCLHCERGERPRAGHALLVAEIVSPGSETQDTIGKPGEYARAGVPHYWVVRLDTSGISTIERHRLDHASMRYKHVGTLMNDEPGAPPQIGAPVPSPLTGPPLRF